ncbi:alpha-ketoacid dehydrogenase subunit alpha/beta [Dinghuibacter silviterrae]|uniref:2-oxoisovalerate dehydrogenase E1 component n=1 Tax=Dinghuibacter silviterrae TaxID=1539049 RepID=A0A4R8DNQ6_9BACT|nr:alpha-ketoacid dehydrogenase subunit alpha/beta [Dinghuibacter silviterrae]TDW99653.1 2-oxoisovalerate dehydrogenase E1 component [Dinghuibacter silviterrae]
MFFDRKHWSDEALVRTYRALVLPRMIEEKMLILLRQGKISKWFSGIGQEAIAVGASLALEPDEWIMPLHRNLGVFTTREMPLSKLFHQWEGQPDGYSRGRERSFHFGSREHHICGMISHLGPQMAVADGTALAHRLQGAPKVSLAFCGDGGTSEGDFHEALNVAAVWDLPVIFIIENNGYGLSTPVREQYRCAQLADRAKGYGMEGVTIDGNNVLTVLDTIQGVREYCIREQKPYLVECMTFRMRGHEEASGTKYVPPELFAEWTSKDPVANYEQFLLSAGVLDASGVDRIRGEIKEYIERELAAAASGDDSLAPAAAELADVYAPAVAVEAVVPTTIVGAPVAAIPAGVSLTPDAAPAAAAPDRGVDSPPAEGRSKRFIDAISEGLRQSMEGHPNLVLMGQDIAEYGGAFKITEGFVQTFGRDRVRNTPLCESAILGAALGLSLEGFKSMVEMQFADFVSVGFNQIVNNLAKIHYRWGQPADVVVRLPTGGGVGAGPFHSQSTEAWFTHVPGLKVVYPSTPYDAKGLLIAAFNDPNPVLFFEHKALYRSVSGELPAEAYALEIGRARAVVTGSEISIITYGAGVHWALEYMQGRPDVSVDLLDLRTLLPLDVDAIRASVARTGKVLVLHEATLTGGVGAEVSAWIAEHCFDLLDAPVIRCASLDTPVPFRVELERQFLAKARLAEAVERLLAY